VRHILDPIERTFREEFPDFQPFPFGVQSWVHTLVRHILLAEPLVRDFGRCFEGLEPAQAEALAEGFRFDRCVIREPLAALLARFLPGQRA
jgi:endoglucanase